MKSTPYLFSLVIAVSTSSVVPGQQRVGTDEIELKESKTALDRATLKSINGRLSYEASARYKGMQVWEIPEVDPRSDPQAAFYLNAIPTLSP